MAETWLNVRYFILLLLHNMKNSTSSYKHICYFIFLLHNCTYSSAIYTNDPQSLTSSAFTRSGVVGSDTKEVRLEKVCNGKSKVELYIHEDSATVLTFNSTTPFRCHLELELFYVKGQYGFFIVFEEMNLSGTWPHTCGQDIVQFGRDNLIFDSYKSPKYCGKLDKLQLEGDENEFKKRMYTENIDREMDIWINIPSRTIQSKITLIVTPYKKVCGGSHPGGYIPCFKQINCKDDLDCYKAKAESICVKKDLFCDGRVNCPYKHGGAADENSELCSGLKGTAAPQLALLIILLILLGAAAVFIYIMMRQFTVCGRKPRSSVTSYNTSGGGGGGGGGDLEMIPTSSTSPSCPLNPPPYSEVVHNPPDDPPKYSDIFTQSTNIIKQ